MGNQREIRQVFPVVQLGVAIPIRDGFADTIANILGQSAKGHFYTYLAPPDEEYTIPNMDFGDTPIGRSRVSRFIIQSGGKMWCGYEAFCGHIASVAQYLADALFLVGDEEDYIDQFSISDGEMNYERVHTGCWRPVEDYIREHFPEVGA
jgi:hypothetical protein